MSMGLQFTKSAHILYLGLIAVSLLTLCWQLAFAKAGESNSDQLGLAPPSKSSDPEESCGNSALQSAWSHGGWNYDIDVIKAQHVAFDEGFGRRLVHHITRATPGLVGERGPVTLADIGAGVGQLGGWLRDHRVENVSYHGFDGGRNIAEFSGRQVSLRDSVDFLVPPLCWLDAGQDLVTRLETIPGAPFHWVASVEVGEHIPAGRMNIFLDNLVALATHGVVLTWAVPGQGGFQHVNEQDNGAVVAAMEERGLLYDVEESRQMRRAVSRLNWLKNTIMVFNK